MGLSLSSLANLTKHQNIKSLHKKKDKTLTTKIKHQAFCFEQFLQPNFTEKYQYQTQANKPKHFTNQIRRSPPRMYFHHFPPLSIMGLPTTFPSTGELTPEFWLPSTEFFPPKNVPNFASLISQRHSVWRLRIRPLQVTVQNGWLQHWTPKTHGNMKVLLFYDSAKYGL